MPFQKGHTPWNKNRTGIYSQERLLLWSYKRKGIKLSESHKRKISEAFKGENSPNFGKKRSKASKLRMSMAQKKRFQLKPVWNKGKKGVQTPWNKGKKYPQITGSKNPNWKGGITPINQAIRTSLEYEEWRAKIFERDNYTCQSCGQVGGKLEADHIKSFALYPELRLELSNGQTLCVICHKKTDTYGWKSLHGGLE